MVIDGYYWMNLKERIEQQKQFLTQNIKIWKNKKKLPITLDCFACHEIE